MARLREKASLRRVYGVACGKADQELGEGLGDVVGDEGEEEDD